MSRQRSAEFSSARLNASTNAAVYSAGRNPSYKVRIIHSLRHVTMSLQILYCVETSTLFRLCSQSFFQNHSRCAGWVHTSRLSEMAATFSHFHVTVAIFHHSRPTCVNNFKHVAFLLCCAILCCYTGCEFHPPSHVYSLFTSTMILFMMVLTLLPLVQTAAMVTLLKSNQPSSNASTTDRNSSIYPDNENSASGVYALLAFGRVSPTHPEHPDTFIPHHFRKGVGNCPPNSSISPDTLSNQREHPPTISHQLHGEWSSGYGTLLEDVYRDRGDAAPRFTTNTRWGSCVLCEGGRVL